MVGTGMLMLLVSWYTAFLLLRGKEIKKPVQYVLFGMTFSGWLATLAGWYVTEIGRQPYLVSGILKTHDAVSSVPAPMIGLTLTAYLIVYAVLMVAFITTIFHLARKAGDGSQYDPAQNKALGIERSSIMTAAD